MWNSTHLRVALVLSATLPGALPAFAGDSAELQALHEKVDALDQQLRVLARQLELKEEAAITAAASSAKVTVNDRGFTLASPDGDNVLRLRGLAQLDGRFYFDHGGANDTFVLRRARIIAEGTFARNFSFQLVPEFGGSSVSILDANFGVTLTKSLGLKFGKFKSPVGLELLQSDSWTFFNERSLVTNLVPNRDLGVEASGELFGGRVTYAGGVFAGVPDGASSTNSDFDRDKEFAGRVMVTPWQEAAASPLQGLSFGVGGSLGREKSAAGRTSGYKTDGQQTFFTYNGSVVADGATWRVSPQLDYRNGPFGLIGEYVVSAVNLRPGTTGPKRELRNRGWQVAAGYVLTGEDSSYNGVRPRTYFDWSAGTWGAFEVTARFATLNVDDAAFPVFAAPGASADEAQSVGLGLNWYLSKTVAFKFDLYRTRFGFNAAAPAVPTNLALRQDETALITRFQVAF